MIHIKKIITLFIILSFISCKSQEMKISVNDNQSQEDLKLKVSLLIKNDTLTLKDIRPNVYEIKNIINTFLIEYKDKKYLLNDVEKNVKSIVVDYNKNAKDGCFVVHKIFGDAIQSSNTNNLKDCSDISNIYLYNTDKLNPNNLPQVKIRKSNN